MAIWHDLEPAGRDEFYAWHGREHMPERVAIPGFLRGRRYVARDADLEFFNLYEVSSPAVLTGEDYRARLDDPTPWTVATVKHFRRVSRSLCRVAGTFGAAQGGLMATWRYDVPDESAPSHIEDMSGLLAEIASHGSVAGAHLLAADASASALENAESKARGEANRVPRWSVLVEGWGDERAFAVLVLDVLDDAALNARGTEGPATFGLYQLQATVDESNL